MVPSGAVEQHRSGSPSGVCQPGGHEAQLGVEGGCAGQLHGGHGGQTPLSGSHEGQAHVQPLLATPPELLELLVPEEPELPSVLPPLPMHSLLPSEFVMQQAVESTGVLPLLPAPEDGGEYQPTGHE